MTSMQAQDHPGHYFDAHILFVMIFPEVEVEVFILPSSFQQPVREETWSLSPSSLGTPQGAAI